ncbi:hypothetical protein Tco_0607563, partial [Tanacetum coccineum]
MDASAECSSVQYAISHYSYNTYLQNLLHHFPEQSTSDSDYVVLEHFEPRSDLPE